METWLDDLFTPAALARHLALLLLVVAVAMPGLLPIRLVALAAGVVLVVLFSALTHDPVGLFWSILFVGVNLVQLALYLRTHRGVPLNGEERLFHERVVPMLNETQTRRLLAAGKWRDVAAGTALTRENEVTSELCFITRGTVDIMVGGRKVGDCGVGDLLGEGGIATGEPASATSICATPVRFVGFDLVALHGVLDRHVKIQDAVELAIQRSLREKLHRANLNRVQAAGAPLQ